MTGGYLRVLVLAVVYLLGCVFPVAAQSDATAALVRDLPVAGGTQRLLYLAPARPRATLVMFPGGAGNLGIGADGRIAHDDNFLVRTRALWLAWNYAVVLPDAVGTANLRGDRSSSAYARIVRAIVAFAKAQNGQPVFLIGTSQGAIAAMNGAAHLRKGEIAGLVLTESVSRLGGSQETVFDAHPEDVDVPALIVANRDDACNVAPPEDAPRIRASLTGAPDARLIFVTGGQLRSRDCGSLSPHGYYGIEDRVVGLIAEWVQAH